MELTGTHQDWTFLILSRFSTVQAPPISGYMPDQLGTTGQLGATGWQSSEPNSWDGDMIFWDHRCHRTAGSYPKYSYTPAAGTSLKIAGLDEPHLPMPNVGFGIPSNTAAALAALAALAFDTSQWSAE